MKKQLKKSLAVLLAAALFATTANLVAFNDGAATAFAEEAPGSVTSNDVSSGESTGGAGSGSTPSTPIVLPENPTPQQLAEALTITMDENYVVSMSSPYDSSKYNSYGFMFYLNDERIVIHANLGFYLGQWGVSYTISEHKGLMNASGTYQFRVALFDSTQVDEVASQVSNEVTYTLPSERLASPVMSCADNKVKWQPVEGASGYLVYEEGYAPAEGIWYNTAGANNCFYMPATEGQPLELSHASIIDWFRNGYRVKVIAVSEDMDAVANSAPSIYTVVEANNNVYYLPSSDDTHSYSPATSMISEEEIPTFTETSLGAMPARIDVVTSAAAAEGIAALEAAYGAEVNASSVSVGREYIPVELPETGLFSAVDISFAIRGEQIHELGFELPLTLAVPVALEDKELAVIHVLNDGGLEQLPVTRDEEGNATFVTTSLSVFILMSKEDADKIVAASPVAAGGSYVVKKGDCLSKIAVKFSTTIAKLLKLNTGIKDANKIYTGQKIKVK